MDFKDRPLAITDLEMTGLDHSVHEIIEMGLVVADSKNCRIIDKLDVKVKPEHPETADATALAVNGYKAEDWNGALTLKEAMELFAAKTKDAIFCAHNVTFDWAFMHEAFKKTGVRNQMDYHRIDLLSLAWAKLKDSELRTFRLNGIAKFLGITEEPNPHRAINGAMTAYEVYKQLFSADAGVVLED
jgi:DNA polymerase III alpha subunit (gram-positive type)